MTGHGSKLDREENEDQRIIDIHSFILNKYF